MKKVEDYFEIIKACGDFPYDDFALCKDKETGKVVVVYAYDGGYAYPSWNLEDLLDFDAEEYFAKWLDAIGKFLISNRPYKDNWGDILKEASKGSDEDESKID